jgi:hypothetical protein
MNLKTKLLVLVAVPAFVLCMFAYVSLNKSYSDLVIFRKTAPNVVLLKYCSQLLEALQVERGMSAGVVEGQSFQGRLEQEYVRTDEAFRRVTQFLDNYPAQKALLPKTVTQLKK